MTGPPGPSSATRPCGCSPSMDRRRSPCGRSPPPRSVSPGLVVHHFGSKEGLRREVDQHVLDVFEAMLGELTGEGGAELLDPGAGASSLSEVFARHLPDDSPLPGYLRRLLLSDTDAGRLLFRRLYDLSRDALDGLAAAGLAAPGADPAVRAALLLANDLALFLLRDRLAEVLGTDPLSADGMARWAPEMLSIYAGGLNAAPPQPQGRRTLGRPRMAPGSTPRTHTCASGHRHPQVLRQAPRPARRRPDGRPRSTRRRRRRERRGQVDTAEDPGRHPARRPRRGRPVRGPWLLPAGSGPERGPHRRAAPALLRRRPPPARPGPRPRTRPPPRLRAVRAVDRRGAVRRHPAETQPHPGPAPRPRRPAPRRALPGLRLGDLPAVLGPGRGPARPRQGRRGHHPPRVRTGPLRPAGRPRRRPAHPAHRLPKEDHHVGA